jgi:hypothetical protein
MIFVPLPLREEDGHAMLEWIMNIDVTSLVLGTVFGTVGSTWYGYYVKRPKLSAQGSGYGGSREFYSNHIMVGNVPGCGGGTF